MYSYPKLKFLYIISTTCVFSANMILLLTVMTLNDVIREERAFDDEVLVTMNNQAFWTDFAIGLLLLGFSLNMFANTMENFERHRESYIYISGARRQ